MSLSVSFLVAGDANSYEIFGRIVAEPASGLNVVYLKIFLAAADLATPTVPLEDLATELPIGFGFQLQAWTSGSSWSHGVT